MNNRCILGLSAACFVVSAALCVVWLFCSFFIIEETLREREREFQIADEIGEQPIIQPQVFVLPEAETEAKKTSLGEFKLTAYCSCEKCCGVWAKNRPIDENGKEIVVGSVGRPLVAGRSIAVDPLVIPYGSVVEFNGNEYSADDCGGAIKGNDIDIYFENHEKAKEFGVQYSEVFLLQNQ